MIPSSLNQLALVSYPSCSRQIDIFAKVLERKVYVKTVSTKARCKSTSNS